MSGRLRVTRTTRTALGLSLMMAIIVAIAAQSASKDTAGAKECNGTLRDSTRIAYVSNRDGYSQIYSMNSDGTDQRRLTRNPWNDWDPNWSPDGGHIAFTSNRDGNSEIYVMSADGTRQRRLTDNPEKDYAPRWSPDGKEIAFVTWREGEGRKMNIYVMNSADGTDARRLQWFFATSDVPPNPWSQQWSPDRKRRVYTLWDDESEGDLEIYIANADLTSQEQLTNNKFHDGSASRSPDGTKIVFESEVEGNSYIYTMNADGTGRQRLTDNPAVDDDPDW